MDITPIDYIDNYTNYEQAVASTKADLTGEGSVNSFALSPFILYQMKFGGSYGSTHLITRPLSD